MFEQHPVPQQISSYQFRLVGDMTLKQFFQLAAGCILGLIMYATSLPSVIKWPLIIIFVVAGAAFAFLPLQERPLEEWITAFFRAAYGPTLYRWKRNENNQFFASNGQVATPTTPAVATAAPADTPIAKLESMENSFLNNVTNMFSLHPKTPATAPDTSANVPQTANPVVPMAPVQMKQPTSPVATPFITPSVTTQTQPLPGPAQPKAGTLFVATPPAPVVSTPRAGFAQPTVPTPVASVVVTAPVSQTLQQKTQQSGVLPQFSPDAAPPTPATIPNIIVGQVLDSNNKIVEGAILEVTDFQGRPVRALKTNKLGHFMIVTPLPNGKYQVSIEKAGLKFDPVNFEVHGAITQPMAIKATQIPVSTENKNI